MIRRLNFKPQPLLLIPKFNFSAAKLNFIMQPSSTDPKNKMNMVVLHGILGSARNFRSVVKNRKISDQVNTFLVDLRNHGNSEHRESMSISEMANDVYQLIREKEIESNFLLMGHSLGARVAIELAVQYPQLPKAVIAVDLAPYNYTADIRFHSILHSFYDRIEKLTKLNLERSMDEIRNDVYSLAESKEEGDLMLTGIQPDEKTRFKWRINVNGILRNYYEIMGNLDYSGDLKYSGPVKVIGGENSEYLSKDLVENFNKAFANFNEERDVVWIEGANHWVHFSQPIKFISQVGAFLESLYQTRS